MSSPIHGPGQSPPMHNRAKQILQSTQSAFEKLKKDLADKEYSIETKNREILQLRMAVEEAKQLKYNNKRSAQPQGNNSNQVDSEVRGQLLADLNYAIDSLRTELTRIK